MVHFYLRTMREEFNLVCWEFVAMRKRVAMVCQPSVPMRLHTLSVVRELQMV